MIPIQTEHSNHPLRGDGADVGDMWAEIGTIAGPGSIDGAHYVAEVWEPTPEERQAIAAGANIKVKMLFVLKVPPVMVETTTEEKLG